MEGVSSGIRRQRRRPFQRSLHELPLLGSVGQVPEDKAEQLAVRHKIIALASNRTLEIPAYRAALTVCTNQGFIVMRAVYDLFHNISSGNEATGNAFHFHATTDI